MPTLEIISIDSTKKILSQNSYDFAIIEETTISSHRNLFNEYLSKIKGTIVHLGNPNMINDYDHGFFAGKLIDWDFESKNLVIPNINYPTNGSDQETKFKFLNCYFSQLIQIIWYFKEESPQRKAIFLSDYQFGPSLIEHKTISYNDFITEHDKNGLRWNTLYYING